MDANDDTPEQFLTVCYPYKLENSKIRRVIAEDGNDQEIALWANKDGMAYLAGLVTDFVLARRPQELAYNVGVQHGVLLNSAPLEFEFDDTLDLE